MSFALSLLKRPEALERLGTFAFVLLAEGATAKSLVGSRSSQSINLAANRKETQNV
jgi:hypothetical protein